MTASTPSRKSARRRRGEVALLGADPFQWLLDRFVAARAPHVKERLALELLPYVRPKLRTVELRVDQQISVEITIGGELPIDVVSPVVSAPLVELPQ